MSHITKLKRNEDWETAVLKRMCRDSEKYRWHEKNKFRAYQDRVDCDAVIEVAGADYEIGVEDIENGSCELRWDSWGPGGLSEGIGDQGQKLRQQYDFTKAVNETELTGNYNWYQEASPYGEDWHRLTIEL